jgi:hypothetical protein
MPHKGRGLLTASGRKATLATGPAVVSQKLHNCDGLGLSTPPSFANALLPQTYAPHGAAGRPIPTAIEC